MATDIGNFIVQNAARFNPAAVERERYANALMRNQVDRLPQQNRAQDLALQASELDVGNVQRQNAAGVLGRNFSIAANSPRPREAMRAFLASPDFVAAGKMAGLPVEQFTITDQDTDESIRQQAQAWAQALGAGGAEGLPSELQTFNALTQGMPAQDVDAARRVRLGIQSRAGATRIVNVGNVPHVVGVDDNGQPFQVPLSTIQKEAAGRAEVAGAEAGARAGAEAQAARTQKAPALAGLDYVAAQFRPALTATPTGGPMGAGGLVGGVFDYQDAARFDNLREQMSTELRTVFRIPGEGTLSDREQAQYGLQLPDRKYSPTVNEAIIEDILNRASLRVTGSLTGGPQVGEVQDGYRFKGGDPSQESSWEKVQ